MNPDDERDEVPEGESESETSESTPQSDAGPWEGLDYPVCRDDGKPRVKQWEAAMRAAAERNGGTVPMRTGAYFTDEGRLVSLPDAAQAAATPDAETLLKGLIEDCRFLIKEVVFHSARLTPDPNDRLRFLSSAETLAVTGAKIGRTIADLRGNAPAVPVEENRYRMIVEHVQSVPAIEMEPPKPKSGGRGRGKGKTR